MTLIRRARSAITGRFVSLLYAKRHPKQTVTEVTVKREWPDEEHATNPPLTGSLTADEVAALHHEEPKKPPYKPHGQASMSSFFDQFTDEERQAIDEALKEFRATGQPPKVSPALDLKIKAVMFGEGEDLFGHAGVSLKSMSSSAVSLPHVSSLP